MKEENKMISEDCSEYITDEEAKTIKGMFKKNLKYYKEKDVNMTDQEWLEKLFIKEIPNTSEIEAKVDAKEIVDSISEYEKNLKSVNEAYRNGISKERWLEEKISESSSSMSVQQYGTKLQKLDDMLYTKNTELEEALTVVQDGEIRHVNRNPNLDGILAENLIAKTTEISGFVEGKNIRVDVLQSNKANSVDVRALNLDTGKYQNYQLKFGKDAAHTIKYIEEGNYNNQRIIVPTEQLEEVQAHFKEKGSSKSISDHIEAWGVEGKKFTKEELKNLQKTAQEEGSLPIIDYNNIQIKDLLKSIGKNTSAMAMQSVAITTGMTVAKRLFSGDSVDADELVEITIKTGADTSIKTVTAGTLQVAIRKGIISFIPKATPVGLITNIACVGIENVKVLGKIASGELGVTKGLDQMGRTTTSMVGGLWAMAEGATYGASLTGWIPVAGPALSIATGFVGGMVGYFGGSKIGDSLYNVAKKVASQAKTVGKAAWGTIKTAGRAVGSGIKSTFKAVANLFRF